MFGTRWATSHPDCMNRLRKHYSHLVEDWFLARKAVWALSGCMTIDNVKITGAPLLATAVCELPSPYLRQLGECCALTQACPN